MKITPLDIRRQEFNRKLRGFDPEEVQTFLEMLSDEFEAVIRENTTLKDRIDGLDSQVASFREMEKTLQDTIVTAQKAREEAKSEALKEADFIVREAELKAERWIEEARQEVMALNRELATLRSHKASFIAKLRALLNSQNELLNVLELDSNRVVPSPRQREEKRGEGGHGAEERFSSDISKPSEASSTHDSEGEKFRAAGPGTTEGRRRPNRRIYGRRNPQNESHGNP
ncbi:MAG: DivIVA domain-containing protein [bacterium]